MGTLGNGDRKQKHLAEPTRLAVLARNLRVHKKHKKKLHPRKLRSEAVGRAKAAGCDGSKPTWCHMRGEKVKKFNSQTCWLGPAYFYQTVSGQRGWLCWLETYIWSPGGLKKMLARNKLALRAFLGPVRADASGCVGSKTHSRHRTFRAYKPIYLVVFCLGRRCCHMSKKVKKL